MIEDEISKVIDSFVERHHILPEAIYFGVKDKQNPMIPRVKIKTKMKSGKIIEKVYPIIYDKANNDIWCKAI